MLDIDESRSQVKVDGPGFKVKLTKDALTTQIDDARFGFPQSRRPDRARRADRAVADRPPRTCARTAPTGRPRTGGASSARWTRVFTTTASRPVPPYARQFNTLFGNPFTFVGTLDATVVNEQGERFRLMMSDLANEVLVLGRLFISTNPIHAYFVDAKGKIRDRASLVGRVVVDKKTGHSLHYVVDRGTCHQRAALSFGGDNAVVFGPFFVLPFNTTVIGD